VSTAFPDIVGHARVSETLGRALAHRAVHTGYLLTGPAGVGKRRVADAFARAFLCVEEGPAPCGACRSCARPADAPHPDLLAVAPPDNRKSIGVEQVRELGSWLALSPAWGRRKAAVVDPADAMTGEAQNALLKTLEEPPPGRVLLLVTARPGALAATIHSRCQRVPHGALEIRGVVLRLAGQTGTSYQRRRP
jgi:DNA polymerase-3 subunit delta'